MCIYMFRKNRIFNGIVSKFAILWDSDSIFSYFIIHEKTDNIKWISIANFEIFFFFILRYHACTFSTTRSVNVTQLSYRWTTRRLSTWQMSDYPRVVEPVLLPTHTHTRAHTHALAHGIAHDTTSLVESY